LLISDAPTAPHASEVDSLAGELATSSAARSRAAAAFAPVSLGRTQTMIWYLHHDRRQKIDKSRVVDSPLAMAATESSA